VLQYSLDLPDLQMLLRGSIRRAPLIQIFTFKNNRFEENDLAQDEIRDHETGVTTAKLHQRKAV